MVQNRTDVHLRNKCICPYVRPLDWNYVLLSPGVAQDRRWKRILRVLFHLFLLAKGEQQWNCAERDKQVYHD